MKPQVTEQRSDQKWIDWLCSLTEMDGGYDKELCQLAEDFNDLRALVRQLENKQVPFSGQGILARYRDMDIANHKRIEALEAALKSRPRHPPAGEPQVTEEQVDEVAHAIRTMLFVQFDEQGSKLRDRAIARVALEAVFALLPETEWQGIESGGRPCCTVGVSDSDHFPKGITWYVTLLPRGYATTPEDRLICAFPDNDYDKFSLREGERPPEIEVVVRALDQYFRALPPTPNTSAKPEEVGHG